MRDVYVGNIPSGKREPKGKETLAKLATLYLKLDRNPVNSVIPDMPFATTVIEDGTNKNRLCDLTIQPDGSVKTTPLIPVAFDKCTPHRIREFIRNPGTADSVVKEERICNDVRLALQAHTETQRNEANQAALELHKRQENLVVQHNNAVVTAPEPTTPEETPPPEVPPPTPEPVPPTTEPVPGPQHLDATECCQKIFEAYKNGIFTLADKDTLCKLEGVEKISQLPAEKVINLWEGVYTMELCYGYADKIKMPRSKLDELARTKKADSFFLANTSTKKLIREFIEDEAKKAGIDVIPF
jgi:hypothetical protein